MLELADAIPLLSVLLGAAITYGVNVRVRRQNAVDDLFTAAIAAVASARASHSFVSGVAPYHPELTPDEYRSFLKEIGREANLNYIRKVAAAREALATVAPYYPKVEPFLDLPPNEFTDRSPELVHLLRARKRGDSGH